MEIFRVWHHRPLGIAQIEGIQWVLNWSLIGVRPVRNPSMSVGLMLVSKANNIVWTNTLSSAIYNKVEAINHLETSRERWGYLTTIFAIEMRKLFSNLLDKLTKWLTSVPQLVDKIMNVNIPLSITLEKKW